MPTEDRARNRHRRVGYDPSTDTYHDHHEWSGPDSLSHTVCRAVGAVSGTEPTSSTALWEVVDPDALDQLFAERRDGAPDTDHLTVTFAGCTVTVYRDGHLVIDP